MCDRFPRKFDVQTSYKPNICCEHQISSGNLSHDGAFDRGKYQSIHRHRGGWMFLCVLIGFSNSRRYLLFISRHCSGFRAPFFSPYFWKELYATGCSLVSYILKQLFTFVSVEWLIFTSPLCGSANIHHYSPVLRWIIVNYYTRESTMAEDRLTNLPIRRVQLIHLK